MIIRIYNTATNVNVLPNVARVVRVYNQRVPSGITESAFDNKGDLLVGTGDGTYTTLPVGSTGQYLTPDTSTPSGLKYAAPSISISDSTNFLINGGFDFAQRQAPGTLTTITIDKYSADRWRITRENADLQYQRNDATSESGLTSKYYGKFKKVTNAGKFLITQIIEGVNSVPLRGKTVIFQVKMKASSSKTIRMAVMELGSGGTMDTIPSSLVSAWGVDSTDPTFGTNLAILTGAESKSVTTTWQNFSVSVNIPSTSKNILVAVWSDADFSANDELNLAEAGLFLGSSILSWNPRLTAEELLLCKRYCLKTFPVDTAPAQNAGTTGAFVFPAIRAGAASQIAQLQIPPMFTTPTVTTYNPSAANAQIRDASVGADCSSTAVGGTSSADRISLSATGNASTAVANTLLVHLLAEAEL